MYESHFLFNPEMAARSIVGHGLESSGNSVIAGTMVVSEISAAAVARTLDRFNSLQLGQVEVLFA